MKRRCWHAWASLLTVALVAGCSGSSEPQAAPGSPQGFDEDGARIRGLVVDDELNPLAGATVAVLSLDLQAETGDDGMFSLGPVEPGSYQVFAQKLGYESGGRQVQVGTEAEVSVQIELKPLRTDEPFMEVFEQTRHLDWGVRIVPVVGGYAGGDQSWSYETTDLTQDMQAMLVEMTWEGTQALAGGMRLRVEVVGEDNELDYTFCVLEGRSPLVCHATQAIQEVVANDHSSCPGDDTCRIQWRGFTGTNNTGQTVDFGVMLDQDFTVYTSHFYRQPMPDGYRARPDE